MISLLTTTAFYNIYLLIAGTLLLVEIVNKVSINKRTKYNIIELYSYINWHYIF